MGFVVLIFLSFCKIDAKKLIYVLHDIKKSFVNIKKSKTFASLSLTNLFTLKLIPIESSKGLCEEPLISF